MLPSDVWLSPLFTLVLVVRMVNCRGQFGLHSQGRQTKALQALLATLCLQTGGVSIVDTAVNRVEGEGVLFQIVYPSSFDQKECGRQ